MLFDSNTEKCEDSKLRSNQDADPEETTIDYTMFEKIRDIIVDQLAISSEAILPTSKFSEAGGIDSLDQVEIIMAIEDTFNIEIPDEVAETMTSVSDILKYVKSETASQFWHGTWIAR